MSMGQRILISVGAYNRLSSVWGEDADVWRPQRFIDGVETTQKTGLGSGDNLVALSCHLP
ncbi:hypothetical protein JB92DRAFT_1843528 [Gautieria morchelliformis]|nr:hypothetical protein JB92DRAFT_1843528 [Gautieria morchelliformis]